jgi:hypothetical protein
MTSRRPVNDSEDFTQSLATHHSHGRPPMHPRPAPQARIALNASSAFHRLLDRVRAGERIAATELVTEIERFLRPRVRRHLLSDRDALRRRLDPDDVLQSAWVGFAEVHAASSTFATPQYCNRSANTHRSGRGELPGAQVLGSAHERTPAPERVGRWIDLSARSMGEQGEASQSGVVGHELFGAGVGGGFQRSGNQARSSASSGCGSWASRCRMSCRYANTSTPCR